MAKNKDVSTSGMTAAGFLWRFLAALVLVLLTYNPSGFSGWEWISTAIRQSSFGPLHLLLLGILAAGWVVYVVATWRALGRLGVALAGVILGAVIWLLYDIGLLQSHTSKAITWIVLIALSAVLAIGVSWSHIWRRITGQINVEDVDD